MPSLCIVQCSGAEPIWMDDEVIDVCRILLGFEGQVGGRGGTVHSAR